MLDELGNHATSSLQTMGKGVTSNSSKSYTGSTFNVRIAPCTVDHISLLHQVDGPVGTLLLKNSWTVDCTLGFKVESPQIPSHARSSVRYLCLAGACP